MPSPALRSRWLLAALLALPLRAEEAPKSAAIGVTVRDIIDTRVSGNQPAECRIYLNLTGDAIADAHSIRRIRVTKAEDMLGRDLVKADAPAYSPVQSLAMPTPADEQKRLEAVAAEVARRREFRERAGGGVAPATSRPAPIASMAPPTRLIVQPYLVLRNPSRQSTAIKTIEGEIELFTPTAANGGLARLADAGAAPGTFLEADALKSAGVRVMYLNPETYAAKREAATAAERDEATGPWSEDFANQMKLLARLTASSRMPLAVFFVDDPKQLVLNLELRASDGRVLDRGPLNVNHPRVRAIYLDGPLPADAQLTLHLAAADALKTYPFKLENVPLP